MNDDPERWCIVANVLHDRQLRTGAKVYILHCNGDATNPMVAGISKGGQRMSKYLKFKRLTNFRSGMLHPSLAVSDGWVLRGNWGKTSPIITMTWGTKAEAAKGAETLAEMWSGIRSFNRDGTELKVDGEPESAAFRRISERRQREKGDQP